MNKGRMSKQMKSFCWGVFLLGIFSLPVLADEAFPIITFTCDKASDVVKIKNEVRWGETGKNFQYSAKRGTFNPWNWVKVVKGVNKEQIVRPVRKVELSCQLSNGIYKIILEPKIFNRDYQASCGKKISTMVTVFRGGALLLDKKPLEEFCHGNAPIIHGVKIFGKTGKVKLYKMAKYRFY